MAAGSTYTPIATHTLGTATNNYTFSSISSSYTDLIIVFNGSLTNSGAGVRLQFNGDTGTNYSYTRVYGSGTVQASDRNSTSDYCYGAANSTARCTTIFQIMNYSNTTTNKTVISRSSTTDNMVNAVVNLWRSTAAINSVRLDSGGYNMTVGSSLTLYGIAAA